MTGRPVTGLLVRLSLSETGPPGDERRYAIEPARVAGLPAFVLHDTAADLHATWVPPAGMLGASLLHRGAELLFTGAGVAGYVGERAFMGIPYLHPWANRLSRFGYRAGGRDVVLDPASPLLLLDDTGLPIHGVLTASPDWSVRESVADGDGARLRAGLSFDRPELLAAFPFAHELEMTVELTEGALRIRTAITAGDAAVPVSFGFHPYLALPDLPRSDWMVELPVRRRMVHDERMLPTGATEATEPITGAIGARTWDDGFDRLGVPRRFVLAGAGRTIAVEFIEGYAVAQIFGPPGTEYLCIEPMTAPVNALESAPSSLTWVAPGEQWAAVFAITPTID